MEYVTLSNGVKMPKTDMEYIKYQKKIAKDVC